MRRCNVQNHGPLACDGPYRRYRRYFGGAGVCPGNAGDGQEARQDPLRRSPVAPGFSYADDKGVRRGFDVDICRAVSAAIFADPDKVEYVPLNTNVRFQAVQSGEVDILSRQNTWSFSRDTSLGLDFGPVVFYDGQGLMAPRSST